MKIPPLFRKTWFIITIAFVIILSLSILLFYRSPRYSLLMIRRAVLTRDYEKFSKYVDIDSVVDNVMQSSLEEEEEENPFVGLVALLAESMKDTVKASFKTTVENGDAAEGWISEIGLVDVILYYKAERSGKITEIALGKDTVIEVSMRNKGWYWQVIEFRNLDELNFLDTEETAEEADEVEEDIIIEKEIGDTVELKTIDFTIHFFDAIEKIEQDWGDNILASEGNQLYKLSVTVHNRDSDSKYIDESFFIIADSESYQYEILEDSLWIDDDNSLYYEEILSGLSKKGNLYFEIPEIADGLYVQMGKLGTNEVYRVFLGE